MLAIFSKVSTGLIGRGISSERMKSKVAMSRFHVYVSKVQVLYTCTLITFLGFSLTTSESVQGSYIHGANLL